MISDPINLILYSALGIALFIFIGLIIQDYSNEKDFERRNNK